MYIAIKKNEIKNFVNSKPFISKCIPRQYDSMMVYIVKSSLLLLGYRFIWGGILELIELVYPISLIGPEIMPEPVINKSTLFSTIIGAPYLETLLFQFLPIKILSRCTKNRKILISVSAILFGLNHLYSIYYILWATVMGVIFAYVYLERLKVKKHPMITITIIHSIYNTISFLLRFVIP